MNVVNDDRSMWPPSVAETVNWYADAVPILEVIDVMLDRSRTDPAPPAQNGVRWPPLVFVYDVTDGRAIVPPLLA